MPSSCGLSFLFHPCSWHSEKLPFWPALFQPLSFSSPPFPPFFPPSMVSSHCPHSSVPAFNPSISVFLTAVPVHMVDAGIQPALLCRNLAWHTPPQCVCVRWLSYLLLGCCCYFFNQWLHFLDVAKKQWSQLLSSLVTFTSNPCLSQHVTPNHNNTHSGGGGLPSWPSAPWHSVLYSQPYFWPWEIKKNVSTDHSVKIKYSSAFCYITWHNNVIDRSTSKFFFHIHLFLMDSFTYICVYV